MKGKQMKHILLATVAAATLSTAAFANPVSTAICSDHNDPALCESAIEALAQIADAAADQNRKIYDAGYGSLDALIEAADTPVEVIKEVSVEVPVDVIVEVDADQSDLNAAFVNGKTAGYEIGLEQSQGVAFSNGHDEGYAAGIAASQGLVDEARADLAAVEANVNALVAEGLAAIDVDKIAHEARKEAIEAIAVPIYEHKQRAGEMFRNDPVAWMTFAMGYIEDLQRQLGLR